ncbi:PIN domain-containing protein [Candidatus Magnetomoraceae bacterium gMMP-15]
MLDYYIKKHRNYGIILDTNLLLLYLVGSYSLEFISKYKRTHQYTIEEYEWIQIITSYFVKIVITPHILAEIWNFIEKLNDHILASFINSAVKSLELFEEDYICKNKILSDPKALKFIGVTDLSVIIAAKKGNYLIFTDDLRAFSAFLQHEVNAINLNHIRTRTSKWLQ